MADNPYQSPAPAGTEETSGQDTSPPKRLRSGRWRLTLWTIGVAFPSVFVWLAGLFEVLRTSTGLGSRFFLAPQWLFLSVVLVSYLCMCIAIIGLKTRRFVLWNFLGLALMLASLWACCMLWAVTLGLLGIGI